MGLMNEETGFDSWGWGGDVFPPLHNIQTGAEAHPASYPIGTGGKGVELTAHFHLGPRLRMVKLYFHSPIHLHGVVLN
jgi:hypothetical protein